MTTFFSVDVETSDSRLGMGYLLTIGVQPVTLIDGFWRQTHATFYVRLDDAEKLEESSVWDDSETRRWWDQQAEEVRAEAFADSTLVRHPADIAARMLSEFVVGLAPEYGDRVFVANPVAFDKPWIDLLFSEQCIENPFHYRSLCLRSMKYGLRPGSEWGSDRETHDPKIPHHAYWDAEAQARDLIAMLHERDAPKDRVS
jgi:hypothetical protein